MERWNTTRSNVAGRKGHGLGNTSDGEHPCPRGSGGQHVERWVQHDGTHPGSGPNRSVPPGAAPDIEGYGTVFQTGDRAGRATERRVGGEPVPIPGGQAGEIHVSRDGSPSSWPGSTRRSG